MVQHSHRGGEVNRRDCLIEIGRTMMALPLSIAMSVFDARLNPVEGQTMPVDTQGFPGDKGRWANVSKSQLNTAPFNRICLVEGYVNGIPAKGGTGWLHAPGVILTAAHVVADGDKARVQFPGQADSHEVAVKKIAKGFRASDGEERECSAADLAYLEAPSGLAASFDPFHLLTIGSATATAIGYHDGALVRHAGDWKDVGPFTAHKCDTDHQHSGCPLFVGSSVYGIHVGLFSGSRPFLMGSDAQLTGYLNSAVRLDAPVLNALLSA
jgi:hypothetical protein